MATAPLSIRAALLRDLIARSEDDLVARVLAYAQRFGFTLYTPPLARTWRASVAGLSRPILEALETSDQVRELHPDENFALDPLAAFGILEAQRHRARGVGLGMFLGLMKYFRQSYADLVGQARFTSEDEEWALRFVGRIFDRIELAYSTDWASASSEVRIEELRTANRALASEKHKYVSLFANLGTPILLLDREDRVAEMNFAAEQLFPVGEQPGESDPGSPASHPLPADLAAAMGSFHRDGRLQLRSMVTLGAAEPRHEYEVLIRQMLDVFGKFDGVTIVLNDVTESLQFERRLRVANEVLERRIAERTGELQLALEALRHATMEGERVAGEQRRLEARMRDVQKLESLGALAGGMAHDFNNLLTTILGNNELALQDLPKGAPVAERLGRVEEAARHGAELCRQILAYCERGQLDHNEIDLTAVVRDTFDLLRASVPKSIDLRFRMPTAGACVRGDASQLRQVVLNLANNAVEAMGGRDGALEVGVDAVHCARADLDATVAGFALGEGEYVALSISDEGCGMDAATREQVFDPFFTTKFAGRGLGLAVVLGIVRGHSGTIGIQSRTGLGTTLSVLLPAVGSHAVVEERPPLAGIVTAPGGASGTALVVDDDQMVRAMVALLLTREGWNVLEAGGGREALATWATHRGEIARIILDVTMPGLDGPATLAALRAAGCDAPTILISGYEEVDIGARCVGLGVAAVLHKPFTREALLGALAGARVSAASGEG